MFELYHGNTSVCAQKVRLVLAAKDIQWESHLLDLNKKQQFDPAYLKLNPNGVVPTLVHDGVPVIESTLINEYLDEVVPEPVLKPKSALGKVKMRMWTKRLDEGLHSSTSVLTFAAVLRHRRGKPGSEELKSYLASIPNESRRQVVLQPILDGPRAPNVSPALRLFQRTLKDMEAALAENPWLAGEGYSLADAALTPYVKRLDMLQLSNLWADKPRLKDWYARVRALPNYAEAVEAFLSPQLEERFRAGGEEAHDAFMEALQAPDGE